MIFRNLHTIKILHFLFIDIGCPNDENKKKEKKDQKIHITYNTIINSEEQKNLAKRYNF